MHKLYLWHIMKDYPNKYILKLKKWIWKYSQMFKKFANLDSDFIILLFK
jgi:hypothetical protein